jgi:hypothetical protein
VDEVDDRPEHSGVGLRKDAVSEVEDVTREVACLLEDLSRRAESHLARREADRGVEVALQGEPASCGLDPARRRAKRDPPVHTDHLGAGRCHQPEELARPDTEVDPGDPEVLEAGEDGT